MNATDVICGFRFWWKQKSNSVNSEVIRAIIKKYINLIKAESV